MSPDKSVNLYQSHGQTFSGYAMAKPPLKRSTSEDAGSDALARSLNNAFYVTSYQSEITKYATAGMFMASTTSFRSTKFILSSTKLMKLFSLMYTKAFKKLE